MSSFSEELALFKKRQKPTEDGNNPFYTKNELKEIENNMKEYKIRQFDKENLHDYVFYAGRNHYDIVCGFREEKDNPKLENETNNELIGNVLLRGKVQNVFELNGVLNGNLYKLHRESDREKFDYELRSGLMHQLWSRCEYEIYVSDNGNMSEIKVDVYAQIMINGFHFEKYCGEHKHLFKKFRDSHLRNEANRKYGKELLK